jgi:S-adenosylmethionine hydrolase
MSHSLITLLTDFGTADSYVAQMKGVILGIAPEATIVDITHAIPPGDIAQGAFVLERAADAFPPQTIHVAVVDPGVGSRRALVGVELLSQRFLAPDNGLLTDLLARGDPLRAHRLENDRYRRNPVAATFHGRDILAPAAARWSRGADLADFGPAVAPRELVRLTRTQPRRDGPAWIGEIVAIDRFGNLISNLSADALSRELNDETTVSIGTTVIRGICRYYSECPDGVLLALIGSTGRLEIAVNGGSAADRLHAKVGAEIRITSRK